MSKANSIEVEIVEIGRILQEVWILSKRIDSTYGDLAVPRKLSNPTDTVVQTMEKLGFEIVDLTGQIYDDGIFVTVCDEGLPFASGNSEPIISEMVTPIIKYSGKAILPGKVTLRGETDATKGDSGR
jgi:hypothetical protein